MKVPRVVLLACLLALLQVFGRPGAAAEGCYADRDAGAALCDDAQAPGSIARNASDGSAVIAGEGFACGPELACNSATQYCAVVVGGPAGAPPGYSCIDVPDAAPWPSCENIPEVGEGCECDDSGIGVTVTCTAP